MKDFQFVQGGRELLDHVQPLWGKLNKHHENKSKYFSENYRNFTFEMRMSRFINDKSLNINIDLIRDKDKGTFVGYCISSINAALAGEIESLFIDEEYRHYGLGDKLMTRAVEWLDGKNACMKLIVVAEGNEDVLEFYQRHGFYKRKIILEQKRD